MGSSVKSDEKMEWQLICFFDFSLIYDRNKMAKLKVESDERTELDKSEGKENITVTIHNRVLILPWWNQIVNRFT